MKALIMDEKDIFRAVTRISHEIIEKNKGTENIVVVGVKTRGIALAQMISGKINEIEGTQLYQRLRLLEGMGLDLLPQRLSARNHVRHLFHQRDAASLSGSCSRCQIPLAQRLSLCGRRSLCRNISLQEYCRRCFFS